MDLVIYWTNFAENKLKGIFDYYKNTVSLTLAQKLVNEIVEKTISLEKNPQIGQKEELLRERPQEFRYLIFQNYKIIYWINTKLNRIEIVNVFDCRQNPIEIKKM